jgi:hypothetical protein
MGALAWLMNLGFAAGGQQIIVPAGGGAPHRKWYSPEIESLLAAQTLASTLWSNGMISDAQRDLMLDRAKTGLKKVGYGKRSQEQPGMSNPWKNKPRAN